MDITTPGMNSSVGFVYEPLSSWCERVQIHHVCPCVIRTRWFS